MSGFRRMTDMWCMPLPFGILCWMEDHFPGRDSRVIHRECPLQSECGCDKRCHIECVTYEVWLPTYPHPRCPEEDWICKLHDNAMWIAAVLRVPVGRGTWRR